MGPEENFDVEGQPTPLVCQPSGSKEDYIVADENLEQDKSFYTRALNLAGKLIIEQRGIERVPENERTAASYLSIGIVFLNILGCIGWSAVNVIVGAQLIHAVNLNVPGFAAIIIIALCTFLISLFGYKIVHLYTQWSWISSFIVFMLVLGVFAHTGDFTKLPMEAGTSEMGNVLSFGSVMFGYATGWASYAADYTVYQTSNQPRMKMFFSALLGMTFPLFFAQMLGVAVVSATSLNNGENIYKVGYDTSGIGGLLGAVLYPHLGKFGSFCLVVFALSTIASDCPNIYSLAISLQVLTRRTRRIPRFIWTFIGVCMYVGIAIPGFSHFETLLENSMSVVGY